MARRESASVRVAANVAPARAFGVSRTGVRLTAAVMRAAQNIWPHKTAYEMALRARVSSRAAEHWRYRRRTIGAEALAWLLRSEDGIHFLAAVMDGARPAWWRAILRAGVLGGIARRRQADLALLRRVADADAAAPAPMAAALLLQDADFYGPLLAAMDAAAGAPDRAMARAAAPAPQRKRRG